MKIVDVVRPGSMYQIIGPVATLKRILSNRSFFLEKGLDISIFNRGHFYQTLQQLSENNVASSKVEIKHRIKEYFDRKAKHSYLLSVVLVEYVFRTIKQVVDSYLSYKRNPDVVVLHAEPEAYWIIRHFKKKNIKTKTVVFFHNDCIPFKMYLLYYPKLDSSSYWSKIRKRYEYIINNADKLCFICEAGMKNINRLYPQTIDKSFLIVNGITDLTSQELKDVSNIKQNRCDNTINLCCVGSVSVRKAQRKVIEALGMLSIEKRKKFHLAILGAGPDLPYCKEFVEKNNLCEIVSFEGAVLNTDVYKHLAQADIFVLLSENEGLPISIIEAMRAGLAIISTNVSGIPELVSNDNGLLIRPDAEQLAEILFNSEKYNWKQMGENSRQLYERKFTFERMKMDYVNMIKSL